MPKVNNEAAVIRNDEIAKKAAAYMIRTGATIRIAAAKYGISKTSLHSRIADYERSDPALYAQIRPLLKKHLKERASNGGKARALRYYHKGKGGNGQDGNKAGTGRKRDI